VEAMCSAQGKSECLMTLQINNADLPVQAVELARQRFWRLLKLELM